MGNWYVVATRQYDSATRKKYAVVAGSAPGEPIDPARIKASFDDRAEAEAFAAKLNQEANPSN